jgi:hypothetical protein
MKVVASYVEDQIITTNPQQLLEQERAREEFQKSLTAATQDEKPKA